jgi:hypothetical protein
MPFYRTWAAVADQAAVRGTKDGTVPGAEGAPLECGARGIDCGFLDGFGAGLRADQSLSQCLRKPTTRLSAVLVLRRVREEEKQLQETVGLPSSVESYPGRSFCDGKRLLTPKSRIGRAESNGWARYVPSTDTLHYCLPFPTGLAIRAAGSPVTCYGAGERAYGGKGNEMSCHAASDENGAVRRSARGKGFPQHDG